MFQKLTHRTAFIFLFTLITWACSANTGIGVTLISYTIDSANSAGPGYTITISAELTNYDSTVYSDTINFGLRGNHQILTNTGIFGKPDYSGRVVVLGGFDSVPAIFSVRVDPVDFAPGPAVVVVWPVCNKPIGDSIVINFNVLDPTGIANTKEEAFTYVVLSNRILLKNVDGKTNFKQVRICNLIGQQVVDLHGASITEIPLPNLSNGMYLCEFISADNARRVIKFMH